VRTTLNTLLPCAPLLALVQPAEAQTMKMGEVLIISTPTPGADTEAFESFVTGEATPAWKAAAPGFSLHLLRADRGDRDGEYLTLWIAGTRADRDATLPDDDSSPFSKNVLEKVGDTSTYLSTGSCTDYELVGADQLGELPSFDILGIHSYQVKSGREAAFEQFVGDTLHPALADSIPVDGADGLQGSARRARRELRPRLRHRDGRRPGTLLADRPARDGCGAGGPRADGRHRPRPEVLPGRRLPPDRRRRRRPVFESLEWTDFVNVQAAR